MPRSNRNTGRFCYHDETACASGRQTAFVSYFLPSRRSKAHVAGDSRLVIRQGNERRRPNDPHRRGGYSLSAHIFRVECEISIVGLGLAEKARLLTAFSIWKSLRDSRIVRFILLGNRNSFPIFPNRKITLSLFLLYYIYLTRQWIYFYFYLF